MGGFGSLFPSKRVQNKTKLVNFWTILGTQTGAKFGAKKSQLAGFSSIDKLLSICD